MISVIVPVGPTPSKQWLIECLDSIWSQERDFPLEVVIIDDAAHLVDILDWTYVRQYPRYLDSETYIKNPWNLGQAASLNIGIAQAKYDLIFTVGGCDDLLMEGCLQACWDEWDTEKRKDTYYHPGIITSEGVKDTLAQGVGLFHRSLWASVGGVPPEAGVGEVDSIFISMFLTLGYRTKNVRLGEQLYWHREHPDSLTELKCHSVYRGSACAVVRDLTSKEWVKPEWIEGYGYEYEGPLAKEE
jgi:hypothetical protein